MEGTNVDYIQMKRTTIAPQPVLYVPKNFLFLETTKDAIPSFVKIITTRELGAIDKGLAEEYEQNTSG